MIRLTIATENKWLDLPHDVRVLVRPRDTALDAATVGEAQRRINKAQQEALDQAEAGQPLDPDGYNAANVSTLNGLFYQYQTEALVRLGVVEWEGVGDDDGNAVAVTATSAAAFAAIPDLADAFRNKYDKATASLVTEGNGSTPTSDGGTAGAASTVSGATSAPAVSTSETQSADGAQPAPP